MTHLYVPNGTQRPHVRQMPPQLRGHAGPTAKKPSPTAMPLPALRSIGAALSNFFGGNR